MQSRPDSAVFMPRRVLSVLRWGAMAALACVVLFVSARVMAQTGGTPAAPAPAAAPETQKSLMSLFWESRDLFTVLLVVGSLAAWTIIIVSIIEIRKSRIAPEEPSRIIDQLCRGDRPERWAELRQFVNEDDALVCRIVRAAVNTPTSDRNAMREAAELAASEESAKWFRKIEPLNVIGNMGPLLGLAGTVWGMIIAFAALSAAGGQANPASLSLGISKALFHTLLGLMLAVPCLLVFGFFRQIVDKHCTRVMVEAADLVELLPADARVRLGVGPTTGGNGASRPAAAPQPRPMPAQR